VIAVEPALDPIDPPDLLLEPPLRDPAHAAPSARDFSLVIEISPAMIAQRPSRQVHVGADRRVDGPGAQGVRVLDHEVPVDAVPTVFK
jgi:hypothetical protein